MLTRWAAPAQIAHVGVVLLAPMAPNLYPSFEWPTAAEIRTVQDAALATISAEDDSNIYSLSDGLYRSPSGQVWIPAAAQDLQLRVCIVAHTGPGGHRGIDTTTSSIGQFFTWHTLREDVRTFCDSCLLCRSTVGGHRTPRPFGEALHASEPNEVIHFDYLCMVPSTVGFK
jgi:Integrase zinc binding domain